MPQLDHHNDKSHAQVDIPITCAPDEQTPSLKEVTSWQTSVLIVLSAHFVVMNTSGFLNSFGALQSHFVQELDESASTVSWIGSTQIFLYFFLGIVSGRLTDIGYFRVTFLAGSLAMVIGIFASSFGSKFWVMFLTLGVGVGLGNGLMSCPMLAVVSQYVSERRRLAIGVAMCGACTDGVVYSGLMRQLIPRLGFSWTMRVIALIQFSPEWIDWTAFRDARFNNYAVTTFMSLLGLYISIFYVVGFSRTSISPPFSYQDSLNLLLVFNAVNLIGRLGSGFIADQVGILVIFVPVIASTAVILFSWITVDTSVAILVGAPIGGALIGAMNGRYMGAQIFADVTMVVAAIFLEFARRADVNRGKDMED
ncbi:hypothetical protein FSST1_012857 [Fusarium sambucinum]